MDPARTTLAYYLYAIIVVTIAVIIAAIAQKYYSKRRPLRPAPNLPITFYPTKLSFVAAFIFIGLFTVLGISLLNVSDHVRPGKYSPTEIKIVGIATMAIVAYLIYLTIKRLITREPQLTLTTNGLGARFPELFFSSLRLVEWNEIEELKPSTYGRYSVRSIDLKLKNGDILPLIVSIPKTSREELCAWLQEYLSRYGGNATPQKTAGE